MTWILNERDFIEALQSGVKRTKDFIAKTTEYHGGQVRTEYMITADIARAFIERNHEVTVECLNRNLVNGMTMLKGSDRRSLRSKRSDVAILEDGIYPLGIIEVKIGVRKLSRIKGDLDKITHTIGLMQARHAANVIGAAVFQIHIANARQRYSLEHFKDAVECIELRLSTELMNYAQSRQGFKFTMHSLQAANEGITGPEFADVGSHSELVKHGHATRYHAILIQSTRPAPSPPKSIEDLRRYSEI